MRTKGFIVDHATDARRALQLFRSGNFDVIIVCHSLPETERQKLIATVKAERPNAYVVMIVKNSEGNSRLADGFVHSLDGPESLLSCIAELVKHATDSASA